MEIVTRSSDTSPDLDTAVADMLAGIPTAQFDDIYDDVRRRELYMESGWLLVKDLDYAQCLALDRAIARLPADSLPLSQRRCQDPRTDASVGLDDLLAQHCELGMPKWDVLVMPAGSDLSKMDRAYQEQLHGAVSAAFIMRWEGQQPAASDRTVLCRTYAVWAAGKRGDPIPPIDQAMRRVMSYDRDMNEAWFWRRLLNELMAFQDQNE